MKLTELTAYLDSVLQLRDFPDDPSNNGLQVEGDPEVTRAVFAVDAALETIEFAEDTKADFLFVHHGLSWGAEPRRFTGVTAKRLSILFNSGISLYAAHLPLDAAPVFGNNARLADIIGLKNLERFCRYRGTDIGFAGTLTRAVTPETLVKKLKKALGSSECDFYGDPKAKVSRIAAVSGGAGAETVIQAEERGIELLITGEFDHQMYHLTRESGINVIAAGHYATETVGPLAVMDMVGKKFGIEVEFADFPTGL